MGGSMAKKTVRTRGSVGREIFEQVEQLTANGAMKKLEAFKQVASSSGRQIGTVAANYYRIARQKGVALQPRQRKAGRAGGSSSKRALSALMAAVQELGSAIERQEREIATLQKENRRIAELRRLLA